MNRQAFEHPAAWNTAQVASARNFEVRLSEQHRDALRQALERSRHLEQEQITADAFELDSIAADVRAWVHEVSAGKGLVYLKNLPIEDLEVDDIARLFFGLGTHFGVAVSQSNLGEKIGHVVNVGGARPTRARLSQRASTRHAHGPL